MSRSPRNVGASMLAMRQTKHNAPIHEPPWRRQRADWLKAILFASTIIGWAMLSAGCAANPWVKPYERDALNDPLLTSQDASLVDRRREAAIAVRQGARGAVGLPGDGCGCD